MNDSEEIILIKRCKEGDQEAFRPLVERHYKVLLGTAYLMTHDHGFAEDAVQQSLVKMWQHLPALRNGNLKAWLVRILINEVQQEKRKKRVQTQSFEVTEEVGTSPDMIAKPIEIDETFRNLNEALKQLPADQKETIILHYFTDLSIHQTAEVLKCREGTVKSRLNRALSRLGEVLRLQGENQQGGNRE